MTLVLKIILLCCLIQGSRCQSFFISLQGTLEALSGSCVIVPCTFTVRARYEVNLDKSCTAIWKRDGSPIFDSSENNNIQDGMLTGNLAEKKCTTIFNNLQSDHNGVYTMRLDCDNLKYNFAQSVTINVADFLPSPSMTSPTPAVVEGEGMALSCSAPAPCPSSPPVLTWSPVLGETSNNATTSVMTFNTSYVDNGRQISCVALYRRQADITTFLSRSSTSISVLFSPRQPNISDSGPVTEGSRVTLTCDTVANPAPMYIWSKEVGGVRVQIGFQQRLSISPTESSNRFHCTVKNRYGESSSVTVIDVRFPPKDVAVTYNVSGPIIEGNSVVLICNSRGNPAVNNYTWYRDDWEMTEHVMTLSIDPVELRHHGDYKCEAMNDIGRGTSPALLLDVQYAPKNTTVFVDPPGPVPDGSTVTLTCTSRANPAQVNVTWYRLANAGKQAVSFGEGLTLNATKLSQDRYFCEAQNIHGTENSEVIQIDVTFAPEILPSSRCVKIQNRRRCCCDSQGNPPPQIRWELPSDRVGNQTFDASADRIARGTFARRSSITLSLLNEAMPYVVCVSMNSLGSDSLFFNISSSDSRQGFNPVYLLVGFSVSALLFVLLLVPLLYVLFRTRSLQSDTSLVNTTDCLSTSKSDSEINTIYANKAMMEKEEQLAEDQLHYASVDFIKLQAHSNGQQGEGEIRGLSSKTAEYAEIRLHSRRSDRDESALTETTLRDEKTA